MKLKFLLFSLLLSCGILSAQDTIRTLLITEARLDRADDNYVELTNMGAAAVNLSQFEFGRIGPWTTPGADFSTVDNWFMLPDTVLQPGATYVMGIVADWQPKMERIDPFVYGFRATKADMKNLVDLPIYNSETQHPGHIYKDSVSASQVVNTFTVWNGRDCWYLRQHLSATDSVVVDQLNGDFSDGTRPTVNGSFAESVAGVENATNTCVLVRKFNVKTGSTDWLTAKGDAVASDWIPIPFSGISGNNDGTFASFWTVGNQGAYTLTDNTLQPKHSGVTVDMNSDPATITVPWGVRRDDSLMFQFEKTPGLAWHYDYVANHEDSAFLGAQTGDTLTIYVCGDDVTIKKFAIIVTAPSNSEARVIPKKAFNNDGFYTNMAAQNSAFCQVTDGVPGMDTILASNGIVGIPFATRTDTLTKYLEMAPGATYSFTYVDGVERADLKEGDILNITAADGTTTKEYYIKVDHFRPSHNANISSITWPDIPDFYKGLFGWTGDTIPNFSTSNYNYTIQVPFDVDGIPALVAHTEALNTKVKVKRATNLYTSQEAKTTSFTATAEDDTTINVYSVVINKELDTTNIQPWTTDPFISRFIFRDQWANNFMSICNPGTKTLDLSHYMIAEGNVTSPADVITQNSTTATADWTLRYKKYIPGYKWQDSTSWKIQPAIAIPDLNVNSSVQPHDVFVWGAIQGIAQSGYPWWASEQCDVIFGVGYDPWGEDVSAANSMDGWQGGGWYLFRIDNDSILQGLKPADDPNDFTLLDVFASGDGDWPVVGGVQMNQLYSYERKPDIYKGNPEYNGSFGTDAATSEWIMRNDSYYSGLGFGWPQNILQIVSGIGTHNMNPVTIYRSTVTSFVYKVSLGYSDNEQIRGVVTGTTADDFLANIIKADDGQALTLTAATTGDTLTGTDEVNDGDALNVLSTDSTNTSKYILEVTPGGLNHDALLTSDTYTIDTVNSTATGTVGGFDYGTSLKTVFDGVTVPAGATITVIDDSGAYVPFKELNYDTIYVDVMVNSHTHFLVVAEDGTTSINYTLMPNADSSAAFVTSIVYSVDQNISLISLIPNGTTVSSLFKNLIPAPGATMKLFTKTGQERTEGNVVLDDKVIVTAMDGKTTKPYYLQMLEVYGPSRLAYLKSDVYNVDQVEFKVSIVYPDGSSAPTVSEVLGNVSLAAGASAVVTDDAGTAKSGTENVAQGDIITVTAEDGVTTNNYMIDLSVTGIHNYSSDAVKMYPNPTSGLVYMSGLTTGTVLHVYNSVGVKVLDKEVRGVNQELSLEKYSSGLYFIVITDRDNSVVGKYKVVLK